MKNFLVSLDVVGLVLFALFAIQQTAAALMPRLRLPTADSGMDLIFLIPALNEVQVIEATLRNLRETVPEARLVVIDDASDDGTDAVVRRLARQDPAIRLLRREFPEARQNKGRAMNWAVARLLADGTVRGDLRRTVFIGLDADGRIGRDFVRQVYGAFQDERVAAAQGWMRYRQEVPGVRGWRGGLARALLLGQDVENFILGHTQRFRHRAGTASLTGNGQCMRASYVAAQLARGVDPWPDVLLEDFGSAVEIRLDSPEHRIAFLDAHVRQQGMIEVRPLLRQRARWNQGTLECLRYLPALWRSRAHPVTLLDFTYLICGPYLASFLLLSILTQPLRRVLHGEGLTLPGWTGLLLSVLPLAFQVNWALRYCRERRLPWWMVPCTVALLPLFGFLTFWALPLAFYNHLSGRKGWYKSVRHDEGPGRDPGNGPEKTPTLRVSGD
ncbi:glycosyl transferase, family 2 [Deinococcus aerius]|uniref:Glycosyl transferase, family 2 n=1 Tax=Deinococcus aerius TaxID=200253 RepID=A0A2I9D244_9DEIO|nr:glycosyltransferase [Deinococcus aerius]GBF04140.1 glycosyl transferase, family 2 [Deinococcus aerius]